MSNETARSCAYCKFMATEDSGYSNYTVTETTVHCLKGLNPGLPAEDSYSWRCDNGLGPLAFGAACEGFSAGEGIQLDVDGDVTIEDYKGDAELYDAAKAYDGWDR